MSVFAEGDKVQALGCDGTWTNAVIVRAYTSSNEYTVCFDGWSSKWNEKLPYTAIRPVEIRQLLPRSRQGNRLVNPEKLCNGHTAYTVQQVVIVEVNDPFRQVILTTDGQSVLYTDLLRKPVMDDSEEELEGEEHCDEERGECTDDEQDSDIEEEDTSEDGSDSDNGSEESQDSEAMEEVNQEQVIYSHLMRSGIFFTVGTILEKEQQRFIVEKITTTEVTVTPIKSLGSVVYFDIPLIISIGDIEHGYSIGKGDSPALKKRAYQIQLSVLQDIQRQTATQPQSQKLQRASMIGHIARRSIQKQLKRSKSKAVIRLEAVDLQYDLALFGLTAANGFSNIIMPDTAKALDSVMGDHWDSRKYATDFVAATYVMITFNANQCAVEMKLKMGLCPFTWTPDYRQKVMDRLVGNQM